MKNSAKIYKLLLLSIMLFCVSKVNAQVSALSDLSAGTLAVYCPSEQVKLTAASIGASSYVWKRYAGITATGTPTTVGGATANLTDVPATPGYYTYVSTALNADNCESEVSDPVIIYVLPGITASIVSSSPTTTQYCANQLPAGLTLTATAAEAQTVTEDFVYKYQWYKGTTAISGATASTYTLNATDDVSLGTNSYTVKVTYVIKACTEVTSNAISFNVLAIPAKPTITITP